MSASGAGDHDALHVTGEGNRLAGEVTTCGQREARLQRVPPVVARTHRLALRRAAPDAKQTNLGRAVSRSTTPRRDSAHVVACPRAKWHRTGQYAPLPVSPPLTGVSSMARPVSLCVFPASL